SRSAELATRPESKLSGAERAGPNGCRVDDGAGGGVSMTAAHRVDSATISPLPLRISPLDKPTSLVTWSQNAVQDQGPGVELMVPTKSTRSWEVTDTRPAGSFVRMECPRVPSARVARGPGSDAASMLSSQTGKSASTVIWPGPTSS